MKKSRLAVVIMRAQLPTNAHFSLIEEAHKVAENVLVLIGSSNRSVSSRNPFDWRLRRTMLKAGLQGATLFNTNFQPLRDTQHMEYDWIKNVEKAVYQEQISHPTRINDSDTILVGHDKDDTTYYVKSFPQWKLHESPSFGNVNATMVRFKFFHNEDISEYTRPGVIACLNDYKHDTKRKFGFEWVVNNYAEIRKFQEDNGGVDFHKVKYGIKFQTTDAMVVCNNHVALIKRGEGIGIGQWALPGGFVNMGETTNRALLRELFEETNIDVPERTLLNGYRTMKRFEGATRDDRGDFMTHCGIFFIEPNSDGSLPKLRAGSDAHFADWKSFAEVERMASGMFLDHSFIIEVMRREACNGQFQLY